MAADILPSSPMRLLQGTAISFVLRVAGAGLGFLFNIVLARLIGAEGAGLIFLALSVVGLVVLAARLGLDGILVREVASRLVTERWGEIRSIGGNAIRTVAAVSFGATIVLWIAAPLIADHVFAKPALQWLLRSLAVAILPWALSLAISELLRGSQRFVESQLIQAFVASAVSLPLLAVLGGQFGLEAAVYAHVAGQIAACLLALYFWHRLLINKPASTPTVATSRGALLKSASPLLGFMMLNALLGTLDTLALGIWSTASEVGIYGIAVRLATLTSFILLAANSFVTPHFAACFDSGDIEGLAQLARRTARLTLLAALPLLLLFLLAPAAILGLIGTEFLAGAPILAILAIAQFVNVGTGSVSQILIMTRHERILRNISLASTCTAAVLLGILVPFFGALGAAIATGVGICAHNIASMIAVQRRLHIRVDAFAVCPQFSSAVMCKIRNAKP